MAEPVPTRSPGSRPGSRRGSLTLSSYRRGSGTEKMASGHVYTWHTRTHENEELPHATKKDLFEHLKEYEKLFTVTPQRLRMIVDAFVDTLETGLKKHGQTVPMIPTWVFGWPSGKEEGSYLAIDLGGTNLRVCHVQLKGEGKFSITQSKFRLTDEQKQCNGQELFDFCAECLKTFIEDNFGSEGQDGVIFEEEIALGFTFSYPCEQDRIDHGKLIRWTKGFGNPNTEGRDCAAMLMTSLEKYHVPIKLTSIINDTTGTLIASNYVNPKTKIACIFGTGCNAAYMEHVADIPKIADKKIDPKYDMAINCEYGAFDSFKHEHLPRTKYDMSIDLASNKPHEQAFEKMISGLYLGEIFRLVICELVDEGVLFLGQNTYKIEKPHAFDTAFLSLIESDPTEELLTVTGLFTHFFVLDTTIPERQFLRRLAQLIGTRAARLSACGIAALSSKMGYVERGEEIAVGCDGSLIKNYPHFGDRIHEALVDIFGEKGRLIQITHAEDGSGVGAALIAAMTEERKADGIHPEL